MKLTKPPKITSAIASSLVAILLLINGCGKKASDEKRSGVSKIEIPHPRVLKPIKIGLAENFSILAYANIYSIPNSSIDGKVGLLPGTRGQIILDPIEVKGGAQDILASDDEATSTIFLNNAIADMVTAYKEAVTITPDNDKIGLYGGELSGKILATGCYKWSGDLVIKNDFTIEGSDTDVWIFKISANFKVASDVHLTLRGGAKAQNIFWQVAGGAVLGSGSVMAGTIIAQQSVEMKNQSLLTGRVFAKNGYINLDQATINKP
ncbi:MAG: DUF3494 domain-containing protein [Bacteriovorax sp.]|nr:DUF3494 domain-containing protein [Bacteriovorax sp.]